MAIVYNHMTKDTDEIFYVGIGADKTRAHKRAQRSRYWKSVVAKHGLRIVITHANVCWEEAQSIERYLIAFYGRRQDGGLLVNLTDGGDGVLGQRFSDQAKAKISKTLSGRKGRPMSEESKEKLRNAKLGVKSSEAHKASLRAAWVIRKQNKIINHDIRIKKAV